MIGKACAQFLRQCGAARPHLRQQVAFANGVLNRECRRAAQRVPGIGMAMLKETRPRDDGVVNFRARQHRANGLIARTQALADANNVRRNRLCFAGIKRSAAAHAAHHFIEDQEHAVAIADFANAGEISGHGWHATERCTTHCFGDKSDDRVVSQPLDFAFQFARKALAILDFIFRRALFAIRIAGRNMGDLD